jgi:hypothetical protein
MSSYLSALFPRWRLRWEEETGQGASRIFHAVLPTLDRVPLAPFVLMTMRSVEDSTTHSRMPSAAVPSLTTRSNGTDTVLILVAQLSSRYCWPCCSKYWSRHASSRDSWSGKRARNVTMSSVIILEANPLTRWYGLIWVAGLESVGTVGAAQALQDGWVVEAIT